jgi:hypothetical protein
LFGEAHRQAGNRICSVGQQWASGRVSEYRLASTLKDGMPKPVASCAVGVDVEDRRCPEEDGPETSAISDWNTSPQPSNETLDLPRRARLKKYDADFDMTIVNQKWMRECLSAASFQNSKRKRSD